MEDSSKNRSSAACFLSEENGAQNRGKYENSVKM